MINLKVRMKNKTFLLQLLASICMPILAYMNLSLEEITSWTIVGSILLQAISNPYVLGLTAVSVLNALTDPTTRGFKDSENALTYNEPK